MRKKTYWKKLIGMMAVVSVLGLGFHGQVVNAVGIHVDESATETPGEMADDQEQIQGEQEGTVRNDTAEPGGENGDEGGIELTKGTSPLLKKLTDAAEGKVNLKSVLREGAAGLADPNATPGTLDIKDGNIIISAGGGYKQLDNVGNPVNSGTQGDEEFTIIGQSQQYGITIETGAEPTIRLKNVQIHPKPDSLTAPSAIDIKVGAKVTLVVETSADGAILTGGSGKPGILLEDGAELEITGTDPEELHVTGGQLAAGISGADNAKGGQLKISGATDVFSYSDQRGSAINAEISLSSKKIVQGSLRDSVQTTPSVEIGVENRDDRTEKYILTLPAGYSSFATSTTTAGGDYVSYYPDSILEEVQDSELLVVNGSASHSFNLSGWGSTIVSLDNLVSEKVTYRVIFQANGGRFKETNTDRLVYDGAKKIGYGELIGTYPAQDGVNTTDVTYTDHKFVRWQKTLNSLESTDGWDFGNDKVVRDNTTLYANWEPKECRVKFISNNVEVGNDTYSYRDTILEAPYKPGSVNGSSLVHWEDAATGEKWVFGDPGVGTELTKLETTLNAVWMQDAKVTFEANAGGDTVTDMPPSQTVSVTTQVTKPQKNPTRAGYLFDDWYKDAACTKKWDFDNDTVNTKTVKIYAGWWAAETLVTFQVGEGETVSPQQQTVESTTDYKISEPTAGKTQREGKYPTTYKCEGWYTDERLTNRWDFTKQLKDRDGRFTLYPKFIQDTCWAVLNPGAADTEPKEQTAKSVFYNRSLAETYAGDDSINNYFTKKGHNIKEWRAGRTTWDLNTPLTEDIELTAIWQPNVYTVDFVTPAGAPTLPTDEQQKEAVYNSTLKAPAYPAADAPWLGYTFQGWYTQSDGGGEKWKFQGETGANTVQEDMTLYAHWTRDEYTVSFHTYEGDTENNIPDQTPLHYDAPVSEPMDPTRDHYTFKGWYKDSELKELWDFATDTVTGNMTLYAGWEGNELNVKLFIRYEPENEEKRELIEVRPAEIIRYGDYLNREALENLEHTKPRLGYTLNGWYQDGAYTEESQWDFAGTRAEPEDETLNLHAYWTWDKYTVNYVTYEGDTVNNIAPQTELRYGQKAARPAKDPVREHYTFEDWYPDLEAEDRVPWDFKANDITGDLTLYAAWNPNVYKLSFQTNGGSSLAPIDVTYGTHVDPAALNTTREGYVLTGWFKDAGLTEAFDPAKDYVDADMTLYAGWELQKYTVTFHFRESMDSDAEETITYSNVYRVGDYLSKPDKVVPHKTLSNWYKNPTWQSEDQWVFKRDTVKGDEDLYAYWSDTMYKVHFETFGGTEIADEEMSWGTLLVRPQDPVHEGGTFDNWYKDAQFTTPWDFNEDFVEGDTTVYAKWNYNNYTVTFDANEGEGTPEPQTLPYGSLIQEPEAPVREGHIFSGWQGSGSTELWNFAQDTVTGDTVLTAQWTTKDPANPANPEDPANPANPEDPANPANPQQSNGDTKNSGTGGTTGTGSGTSSNSPLDTAVKALNSAAEEIKKIVTGDKAPLTYAITGIFLSAAFIIWRLIKKFR